MDQQPESNHTMKTNLSFEITRRDFLRHTATATAALALGGSLAPQLQAGPGRIPVGVQLYSVRDQCAKDLPGTLAAIAKIGYKGVEFAGYHGRSGNVASFVPNDLLSEARSYGRRAR